MLTPKNKTTNNLPQMKGDLGYGLGFFCGCLVGAVGAYIVLTPEGAKLKQRIIREYHANQQLLTLETLKADTNRGPESTTIQTIKTVLASLRQKLSNLEPPKSNHLDPASDTPKSGKKHYFKKK